jgi:hypothetical protein
MEEKVRDSAERFSRTQQANYLAQFDTMFT